MLDAIRWDTDLIRRYDQAGPRYTSYPTAVQFHDGIGSFDLLHALRDSRKAQRPLSLYVHVPFCANICYYCACNKVITKDRGRALPYLERLEKEIELISCHLDPKQQVEQLHFGGGTPTFLSHDELRRLMAKLRKHFNLLDDDSGDYGIEIDPREADWSTMGRCVNSASTASASACKTLTRWCSKRSTACKPWSRPAPSSRPRAPCSSVR